MGSHVCRNCDKYLWTVQVFDKPSLHVFICCWSTIVIVISHYLINQTGKDHLAHWLVESAQLGTVKLMFLDKFPL